MRSSGTLGFERKTGETLSNTAHHDRFVRMFDDHGPAVRGLLLRLAGSGADADDLFQETAVRVWRALPGRNGLANERGWLTTIAYRVFVDARRSRKRRPAGAMSVEPVSDEGTVEEAAEERERAERARAALDELAEPIREVFALHYTAGLSLRETAEAMGLSEGTVKSRLNRGLRTLRRTLG